MRVDDGRWGMRKSEGWERRERMGVRWCELEGMGLGRVLEHGRVGYLSLQMVLDHAISRERDVSISKFSPVELVTDREKLGA